jgi:hypothetical protein
MQWVLINVIQIASVWNSNFVFIQADQAVFVSVVFTENTTYKTVAKTFQASEFIWV